MKVKYQTYQIEYPNGEKELVKVPTFFAPVDVVKRLTNCLVEIVIDKHQRAIAENHPDFIQGPAILRVNGFGKLFL